MISKLDIGETSIEYVLSVVNVAMYYVFNRMNWLVYSAGMVELDYVRTRGNFLLRI